jgi:hypothetical protein
MGSIPAATMIFSDVYASRFSFPRKREREGEGGRGMGREILKRDKQTERIYH